MASWYDANTKHSTRKIYNFACHKQKLNWSFVMFTKKKRRLRSSSSISVFWLYVCKCANSWVAENCAHRSGNRWLSSSCSFSMRCRRLTGPTTFPNHNKMKSTKTTSNLFTCFDSKKIRNAHNPHKYRTGLQLNLKSKWKRMKLSVYVLTTSSSSSAASFDSIKEQKKSRNESKMVSCCDRNVKDFSVGTTWAYRLRLHVIFYVTKMKQKAVRKTFLVFVHRLMSVSPTKWRDRVRIAKRATRHSIIMFG